MLMISFPPAHVVTAPPLDRERLAMGTRLDLHLEGAGDLAAASEAAFGESDRIESACSTWNPDSLWSRLNARGKALLPSEWVDLLTKAKAWSLQTQGAFDPVLGRLLEAWGVRTGGRIPDEQALAAARAASGASHLCIRGQEVRLTQGAWIEEGGFVKGYALDRMATVLRARGVVSAQLNFGGQILVFGRARQVAIADPRRRDQARLSLSLKNASLACSGDSERGRHILDPRTGKPCEAWGEVAVVAPTGVQADVLSKLYVMGPRDGLRWADAHGTAAAFLTNDGTIHLSRAFRALKPVLLSEQP